MGTSIKGIYELRGKLKYLEKEVLKGIEDSFYQSLTPVKAQAQELCPVKTSTLKKSISIEIKKGTESVTGKVGTYVYYGKYVELGTSRARAKPYLRPAFHMCKYDVNEAVQKRVKKICRKACKL